MSTYRNLLIQVSTFIIFSKLWDLFRINFACELINILVEWFIYYTSLQRKEEVLLRCWFFWSIVHYYTVYTPIEGWWMLSVNRCEFPNNWLIESMSLRRFHYVYIISTTIINIGGPFILRKLFLPLIPGVLFGSEYRVLERGLFLCIFYTPGN